ncbi:hypothetical protein CARUB_v10021469mg [Capsella rubella]|uniref:S-protein homolog n=1 Tax=Capsella rubella TaxID=81985 RepID=R0HVY1_9BRAS|nr:S-protein homolog 14 [Capsella rubella]EOA33974.1 hypothetical protein CARUB_v10021469mg [Capsella rubella]
MNRLILFTFVVTSCFGLNAAFFFDMFPCPSNEVIITNDLGPGLVLQYHCHSRDDNLGVQHLQYNDTKRIKFGDKIGKRTRWTCLLKHGIRMQFYREFIAYRMANVRRCNAMRHWYARKDGIYINRNQRPPPVFIYPWNTTK